MNLKQQKCFFQPPSHSETIMLSCAKILGFIYILAAILCFANLRCNSDFGKLWTDEDGQSGMTKAHMIFHQLI